MNNVIPNYSLPGAIFSITSLALVVPVMFMFRQYFRSLDFIQMSYLFGLSMYSTSFSTYLNISFIGFDYNFFTFCRKGDLVCTLGFQLSFGSVLVVFLLLIAIIVRIQRCGKQQLQFQPLYLTFKGFFKWFYLPCTYYSASYLVSRNDFALNQGKIKITNIGPVAAIGGFCLLFPICQLIYYKCIQTEQTSVWRKWLQFFGYLRLLVSGTLLALYAQFQSAIYLHCVMGTLILYPFIYTWKGEFRYPTKQRIIFVLGQAAFLANFFIFKYRPQYIQSYDIDFFFIAFIIFIDFGLYFIRACRVFIYGVGQSAEINPQMPNVTNEIKKRTEKINRYDHDTVTSFRNSGDNLNATMAQQTSLSTKKSKK